MMVDPIIHHKHTRWDPKDGELCLSRVKPGETLVEARSDADVSLRIAGARNFKLKNSFIR
jgi:hypothetical protein